MLVSVVQRISATVEIPRDARRYAVEHLSVYNGVESTNIRWRPSYHSYFQH